MEENKFDTDKTIIDKLKALPTKDNASIFVHVTKEGDKNFISYFLEANVDDLSSMLMQLFNEPGFKSAVYRSLISYFELDPTEKMFFKQVMDHIDKRDLANMN